MKLHNYVIFDCETGGLSKKDNLHALNHPITQIALIGLDGSTLDEIQRYESYIKGKFVPSFKSDENVVEGYLGYSDVHNLVYQKQAFQATGISVEKLESLGQDAKKVCNDLIDFFEKCKTESNFHKIILVGHNVVYDIPFLQMIFKIFKKDLSKYLQGYYDHTGTFTPVYFDTQFLSRAKCVDDSLKHNLTEVATREGFELVNAHEAMADTIITKEIFKKYLLQLRNSGTSDKIEQKSFRENFKFEY